MPDVRLVFLLGFAGSGKTSLGRRFAKRLDRPFVDLDERIEARAGRRIAGIFAVGGEPAFRDLESDVLRTESFPPRALVATGGGAPCFGANMDWLLKRGLTVYLRVPPEILYGRLKAERAGRPLVARLDDTELKRWVERTLAERAPFYRRAELVLDPVRTSFADMAALLERRAARAG